MQKYLLAALGFLVGAATCEAAAIVNFSGGSGAPLSITLPSPVSFTITQAYSGTIAFVIRATGDELGGALFAGSSSLTYTLNGATTFIAEDRVRSGFAGSFILANDTYIYSNGIVTSTVVPGNTIVLSAGTFVTTNNVALAPPGSGSYQILLSGADAQISSGGVSVPEPAALCGLSTLALLARRRRAA